MGEALLSGMLRAGKQAEQLVATERHEEPAVMLPERYGVEVVSIPEAVKLAQILMLTVKPQDMGSLLDEIGPLVSPDQLVISVAAGIPTSFIERRLPSNVPFIRVMSNT